MKKVLKDIIDTFHKYGSEHAAAKVFGFDEDITYDALVVAPSYDPYKLKMDKDCEVLTLKERAYTAGYLVKKDNLNIAWIRIGSSAGNTIDHLAVCGELSIKQLIFVGSAGGLKKDFHLGDVCTPSFSISGSNADLYLKNNSIHEDTLFSKVVPDIEYVDKVVKLGKEKGYNIRKASVFCTPSIVLEYTHLDEIREFDTDLIEQETSSFYLLAELFELPSVALLVVSDNSANYAPLVGRSEEGQQKYERGRDVVIPDMILTLAKMQK